MDQDTADIDKIVDALFNEVKQRKQTPRTDMMLDAYNDLIVGRVERNPAIPIPTVRVPTRPTECSRQASSRSGLRLRLETIAHPGPWPAAASESRLSMPKAKARLKWAEKSFGSAAMACVKLLHRRLNPAVLTLAMLCAMMSN